MKGYRTVILNVVFALPILASVVLETLSSPEFQYFVTPELTPYVMLAMLAANIYMRFITTTPLGEKE